MKTTEQARTLEVSGQFATSNFTILASAKAFSLLVGGLYSQKIAAIVRELATNAMDSHIAAGNPDVPFLAHLPNDLEPFFAVRDTHGTGMSPDFVATKYSCFFMSDKTETNEQSGCFGLGSKTPFAYTDSYTLTSIHNGVKTVYNPLLDDKGNPVIMKLSSESTDEPNGVEIKLSVKKSDFHTFAEEAKKIYSWFKVRPVVTGRANFQFYEPEFLYKTEKYGFYKKYQGHGSSLLVMGNVAYPFSIQSQRVQCRLLQEHGVVIFANIGDVQITPSRESLSMDDETKKYLESALNDAVEDIGKKAFFEVENAPSLWEARKIMFSLKKNGFVGTAVKLTTVKWNNIAIESYYNRTTEDPPVYVLRKRKNSFHRRPEYIIDANDYLVYVDDMTRGGRAAITRDMNEKKASGGYVIELTEEDSVSGERLNKMLDDSGLRPIVIYASTLPKLPKVKRTRSTTSPRIELYDMVEPTRSHAAQNYWVRSNDDSNTGGVYVVINRYSVLKDEHSQHPRTLTHQLQLLGQLGFTQKIHGVAKANLNKLKKAGNWIEVWDYLDNCMEKLKKDGMVEKAIDSTRLNHVNYYNDIIVLDKSVKLNDNSPLKELADKIKSANKTKDDRVCFAFKRLCHYMGVELKPDESLGQEKEEVMKKYPMLTMVGFNRNKQEWKAIEDYINMVEERSS